MSISILEGKSKSREISKEIRRRTAGIRTGRDWTGTPTDAGRLFPLQSLPVLISGAMLVIGDMRHDALDPLARIQETAGTGAVDSREISPLLIAKSQSGTLINSSKAPVFGVNAAAQLLPQP
jgi:hypothetical protein